MFDATCLAEVIVPHVVRNNSHGFQMTQDHALSTDFEDLYKET
jgi:hypothetical protein